MLLFIDKTASEVEIYGFSPSFPEQEIIDSAFDYINMSTREITNQGYRPTDIVSVDYFSNGAVFNATLWLLFPFKQNPPLAEIDYGMLIDSDFDSKTGFGGMDYNVEIKWNLTSNSWTYSLESWSPYGEKKVLVKKPNYSNFYEKGQKYVFYH